MPAAAHKRKPAKRAKRAKPASRREFRIELVGRQREDGSLFVTSPNLRPFSAVLSDGEWMAVVPLLMKFLTVNFGRVRGLRLIEDASELVMPETEALSPIPPAYVVAELSTSRVGAR